MAIWGKLLGTAAGLAVGGPLGALLGGVAGHVYDRWRREPKAAVEAEPVDQLDTRRIAYATAVIVLGAKLAKADGAVSRDEVRAFKELFDVDDEDVGGIARIFDEAKRTPEGFEPYARQVAAMFGGDPEVLEELLDDPHLKATGFFTEREHPTEGPITTFASPLDFEKTKVEFRRHAPMIGGDGVEVLREAGLSDAAIDELKADKALIVPA